MLLHRFRRWPLSSKVYAALAVACAIASFALVQAEAERAATGSGSGGAQVVVAARPIQAGATLTEGDLEMRVLPQAPPAALSSVDLAVGKVAVTPFLPDEPVVHTRLTDAGGPLTASVPPGRVAMSVGVQSLPGGLAAGDRVDILATFAAARPNTSLVAEDVRVMDVGSAEGLTGSSRGTQVLLELEPAAARGLAQAEATGVLAIVVRGYEPLAG